MTLSCQVVLPHGFVELFEGAAVPGGDFFGGVCKVGD